MKELIAKLDDENTKKELYEAIEEDNTLILKSLTGKKAVITELKKSTQKEKPPAMSYFEALAKEYVKEDSKKLAELGARLFRFCKRVKVESVECIFSARVRAF